MRGGVTGRPAITTCTCSETLVRMERKKLVVLRGIEGQLERQTALQEEMVRIKQERLELHRRQLVLAEAQFNRPFISVPIILPQDSAFCPTAELAHMKLSCVPPGHLATMSVMRPLWSTTTWVLMAA
ncbi:uncharacterized protein LOC115594287 isoform X2 [Sparus aurata]|uniref:uncharacterized protein LOC115594287 isoform X2 n=1 Tax=Sparus aurata TaxID=8175 RepID=UPI0011C15303|nr:uncharacterized protein LOC115594287 isoform X2 [Sparus aurata]